VRLGEPLEGLIRSRFQAQGEALGAALFCLRGEALCEAVEEGHLRASVAGGWGGCQFFLFFAGDGVQ